MVWSKASDDVYPYDSFVGHRGLAAAIIWRAYKDALGASVSGCCESGGDEKYHEREAYVWLFIEDSKEVGSFFWCCQVLEMAFLDVRDILYERYREESAFKDLEFLDTFDFLVCC